jgi:hypothetical protein
MYRKEIIVATLAALSITAVLLALSPLQEVSTQEAATALPETQWFNLKGISLGNGEFLDLIDTTPVSVVEGHVALYVPCKQDGTAKIHLVQGTVDVHDGEEINTLAPVDLEFIPSLSTPGKNCLYHADIGSHDETMTDFAIINLGNAEVKFKDRNTIAFTIAEGVAIEHDDEEPPHEE